MSVEVAQKVAAVTLIAGSLGGGYFALTGGSSGTLKGMHLAQNRQLITDGDSVANEYIKDDKELIEGVSNKGSKVKENIKKGCESKGGTYYLGATDKTYRSYALGCLQKVDIDTEFTRQGLKGDESHGDKKLEKYKNSSQQFIKENDKVVDTKTLTDRHIKDGCEKNKKERYKYQGDNDEYRMRNYCYGTDEELAEANKPQPEIPPASPDAPKDPVD